MTGWLKVYAPDRTPAHWLDIIEPGEHGVFILDAGRRVPKDCEGRQFGAGEASVRIEADFAEAVRFSEELVRRHPELCCEIYGHEGKSGEPLRRVYEPSVRGKYEGAPFARRETGIGLTLWAVAALFIVYDITSDLRWMWGYIVGMKLVVIGSTYLIRGVGGLCQHRFGWLDRNRL